MRDKLRQLDETYLDLVCSRDDHNDDGKHPEVRTDGYSSGKPEYDQECVDKICSDIGYFIRDDQT